MPERKVIFCWFPSEASKLRRRPEIFATFDILNHDFLYFSRLVKMAGGVIGFTHFIVDVVTRVLDRTHKGLNERRSVRSSMRKRLC